eukprot:6197352-Pleurochrysis_carterae.AAC.3
MLPALARIGAARQCSHASRLGGLARGWWRCRSQAACRPPPVPRPSATQRRRRRSAPTRIAWTAG